MQGLRYLVEFRSRVTPAEPLSTTDHKPGVKVDSDTIFEFYMEKESQHPTNATDTVGDTTFQVVHTGLGKPTQGQSGAELHDDLHRDRTSRRKKEQAGLEGVGENTGDSLRQKGADLPEGVGKSTSGKTSPRYPVASERIPTSAEEVATEGHVP
ncbi:uncharacterized protein GGS22DRAFT_187687 [Annulohypoxylon maeteangense]|uniref:uncharacterized protein n=1 Tax=Annulohypoxylon maeteangense TaxID=1927788 RepID=UPI00200825A2|nr:uncharacterized protein GGS22DRAFT_187687 [Annulohypoxylon maeteangense]KAI0886442.1 hypothetical protein GGS22DRAFT_187687 [Annulohypoxylon maeteangense]